MVEPMQDESGLSPENLTETPESEEQPGGATVTPETEDERTTEDEDGKEHKPNRLEARFSELTGQRNAERERAERAERESEQMREQLAQLQAFSPIGALEQQKPRLDNFETADEYEQAYGQWVDQRGHVLREFQQQQELAAQHRARHSDIFAKGKGKYEDFDAVVNNPSLPPLQNIAPGAFGVLWESEHAADLAYKLAKEPVIVQEMQRMSPVAQARKMLQLEQSFSPSGQTSPTSSPTRTLPAGAPQPDRDLSKMSMKEYAAYRAKQRKEKGFRH